MPSARSERDAEPRAMAEPTPLPPRPEPPDPADCCGSGCVRCIFDLYDDQLRAWRQAVAEIEAARGTR